jgi:hypothetical protein
LPILRAPNAISHSFDIRHVLHGIVRCLRLLLHEISHTLLNQLLFSGDGTVQLKRHATAELGSPRHKARTDATVEIDSPATHSEGVSTSTAPLAQLVINCKQLYHSREGINKLATDNSDSNCLSPFAPSMSRQSPLGWSLNP